MAGELKEKKEGESFVGEADVKPEIKRRLRFKVIDNSNQLDKEGITEDDPRRAALYDFRLLPFEEQE